jgi:hypothetical protein
MLTTYDVAPAVFLSPLMAGIELRCLKILRKSARAIGVDVASLLCLRSSLCDEITTSASSVLPPTELFFCAVPIPRFFTNDVDADIVIILPHFL